LLQRIGDKGLAWENKSILDLSTELVLTMLMVQLIKNYGRSRRLVWFRKLIPTFFSCFVLFCYPYIWLKF